MSATEGLASGTDESLLDLRVLLDRKYASEVQILQEGEEARHGGWHSTQEYQVGEAPGANLLLNHAERAGYQRPEATAVARVSPTE